MYSIHQIPFFEQLADSKKILLAGAGGGFDIYAGIPLYLYLKARGYEVIIANLSFTALRSTTCVEAYPHCFEIAFRDQLQNGERYFPEKILKTWLLHTAGHNTEVYGLENTGPNALKNAYKFLIKKHGIDTIVLVDGGTDSLMFGDESGLGTPQEDITSMVAAYRTGLKKILLTSIGFGIDHYHGVSHYHFLENLAEIMREDGYLGLFPLMKDMREGQQYIDLISYANLHMSGMESIVSNSIMSSVEGQYGNVHNSTRTAGSELWINPLMSIYWCFDLRKIIKKIKYYDLVKDCNTVSEFKAALSNFRSELTVFREKRSLPL